MLGMLQTAMDPIQRLVLALVDDDEPLRRALTFECETAGFLARAFADAEAAWAADDASSWGCLIVDLRLPGMSGLDLAERLRRRGHRAPVILITSNPSNATRARARAVGMEIVEKPLLGGELISNVRRVMAI